LLESTYEACLAKELALREIRFVRQQELPVVYKGEKIDCGYRLDLIIEERLIVELKSVEVLDQIHTAQLLTYLKLTGIKTGLIINFNVLKLVDGIRRVSN